jgi:hypothetical protein
VTEYVTTAGTPAEPEVQHEPRTMRRNEAGGEIYMMTEIGDGVFVQWSQCATCAKHVGECGCPGGPKEPDYMTRWRTQRFTQSFADRGVEPRATPYAVRQLLLNAQEAADAAYHDSNDSEIDLLRGVAEEALGLLGLKFPEGRDPDDEGESEDEFPDDPDNLSGMDLGDGLEDPRSLVEVAADETDAIAEPFTPSTAFERPADNTYHLPEDSGITDVGTPPTGKEQSDVGF